MAKSENYIYMNSNDRIVDVCNEDFVKLEKY